MSQTQTPLNPAFNAAVLHIAGRLFPTGFDIAESAPETYEALLDHVAKTGRMLVWSGASDSSIYADREVNFAFRAWHDWCHLFARADFSAAGEAQAMAIQQSHIRALYGSGVLAESFCRLIECEVLGQASYVASHGHFPEDQMAFTRDWLELNS